MFKASRPDVGGSFLPAEYVRAQAEHRTNFLAIVLFLVIMGLLVSAFLITNRRWEAVRQRDAKVTSAYKSEAGKIQQLHELERRQAEIAQKAQIVNALHERIGRSVLLAEINTRRPNDNLDILELTLTGKRIKAAKANPKARKSQVRNLSQSASVGSKNQTDPQSRPSIEAPRFEHTLELVGVSRDNASITDYLSALVASPLLEQVELAYIEQTVIEQQTFRKFEIRAHLRENVDPREIDLARYDNAEDPAVEDPVVEAVAGEVGVEAGVQDGAVDGGAGQDDAPQDGAKMLRSIFAMFGGGED